ncbi:SDR family oxidoreductase [Ammoniphilus sp. CFH 90114]|uniref:SDR family oxidoreductase n=1 Tax=Ammoniphilus sp. CFH 90114 TaxID=2493665 RepID=UPI00100E8568|nr:SDR family oxidoreductase [Ammoniphilus sp. CFH 90114]RXT03914.1 SDR family oxidoreductase [Ammoniphilus sp. CFH 90114]
MPNGKGRVTGKIVLITGATSGIGEAASRHLINEGARVVLTDVNEEKGIKLAEQLGKDAYFMRLDVKYESEWKNVIEKIIQQFKRLDVLINNAGITGFQEKSTVLQDPENASIESWHAVHAVNLDGTFLGCKYGIRAMKETGGSIINISSHSGMVGVPHAAAYASSKAAIRNHTKTVALYCAEKNYNIRCNSIHPGAIFTPIWEPVIGTGELREKNIKNYTKNIPLKRFGTVEEVAFSIVYLASEESAYTTGIELVIDGGMLAGSCSSE